MAKKETKKTIQRRAGLFFIKLFTLVCGLVPLGVNIFFGKVFGVMVYWSLRRHRRASIESLSIAFPEISFVARKKLTKKFFIFMVEGGFELLYYLKNADKIKRVVKIKGKRFLDKALARGKGVILVTAHYGNFPLMSLRLAAEGYPVHFVARPMRDKYAEGHFDRLRTQAGVKTISAYPRKACVSGIINALAKNEIVIIQMDQNFGTGGVWVDFFGKLAATPTGPIVLSLRTRAALVPSYISQVQGRKHIVNIFPEEELSLLENKEKTILTNAAKFTKIIEGWIREEPYQWSWIHRRWKSRPPKMNSQKK